MISHDFRQGLLKRLPWLLLPLGLLLAVILMSRGIFIRIHSETGQQPSLGSYLYYIFSGCLPADVAEKRALLPIWCGCWFKLAVWYLR